MRNKKLMTLVVALSISLSPGGASADTVTDPRPEISDVRMEAILAVNPGLSLEGLETSISSYAATEGVTREVALQLVYKDSAAARTAQAELQLPDATIQARNSGGGDDGEQVSLGCAYQGYFTYSFARNLGVNHGHNVLFIGECTAIHAPGEGQILKKVGPYYKLWSKPDYPAHVRRVAGASRNAHDRAAAFAVDRWERKLPYNSNFAFNKTVWDNKYNCSQLVWAAWMYANGTDLDRNGGPGVYPEDLWKSPKTVVSRYLVP